MRRQLALIFAWRLAHTLRPPPKSAAFSARWPAAAFVGISGFPGKTEPGFELAADISHRSLFTIADIPAEEWTMCLLAVLSQAHLPA